MAHTIWITSDHHFLERRIIHIDNRPYNSLEEMTNDYVEKWNCLVHKNDTIYHLGDFISQYAYMNNAQKIFKRLNGRRKILIQGNHDLHSNNWYRRLGFIKIQKEPLLIKQVYMDEKIKLLLSHEPVKKGNFDLNLHGHNHAEIFVNGNDKCFNVAVNLHGGYPLNLEMIMNKLENYRKEQNGTSKIQSNVNS